MWKIIFKWFVETAWPVIRSLLGKYAKELLEFLFARFAAFIMEWVLGMGKEKAKKAEESYEKAQAASDPEEKKKYTFEAEFYKKEAESYVEKLKEMEEKLEKLKQQTEAEVVDKTAKLKAEDLFDTKNKTKQLSLTKNNILMLDDGENKKSAT
jgi:hypothetical protein